MTQPGKTLDGAGCMFMLLAWMFTWVSYEFYHAMRESGFTPTGILFALASVGSVIVGAVFLRSVDR